MEETKRSLLVTVNTMSYYMLRTRNTHCYRVQTDQSALWWSSCRVRGCEDRGESDDLTAVVIPEWSPVTFAVVAVGTIMIERFWRGSTLQQRGACQAVSSSVVSNDPWLTPGEGEGNLRC